MSVSIDRTTQGEFCDIITKIKRAIIPVGSMEQHGEHLPVSTDSLIAENIARLVAEQVPSFIIPPVLFGVSYEHRPMFNISIRNSTLSRVICDICCSLVENGIKHIIIINGHHGNIGALQYIAQDLYGKIPNDITIHSVNYWHLIQSEFDHAGDIETSLMLAIAPELVRMDKAESRNKKTTEEDNGIFIYILRSCDFFPISFCDLFGTCIITYLSLYPPPIAPYL